MKFKINMIESNSFRNILNIAKYTFKTLKITYIIEAILLFIGLFSSLPELFIYNSNSSTTFNLIPLVLMIFIVNFILHLITFYQQTSKEYGALIFLTPTKGWEFILGHFLELILANGFILISFIIVTFFSSKLLIPVVLLSLIPLIFSLLLAHLIISASIIFVKTYIRNTVLCILGSIFLCLVGKSMYSILRKIILSFLPYFYVRIGKLFTIEIDIFSTILGIVTIIAIQILASYMIDKKLDIR